MHRERWRTRLLAPLLAGALAACATPPTASPTADHPDAGVLFFHRYSSYAAWDARLFEANLATGALADISSGWTGVTSPINAHADAAGQAITFMASSVGLDEPEWDVFVSRWDGNRWAEPQNLTGPNGRRDEDPKFAVDGSRIVYKQDGVLATISAGGGQPTLVTKGLDDSSMPFFTSDGRGIVFERGGSILLLDDLGTRTLWAAGASHAYYPIVVDASRFLFTEVQASHHDRIVWGSLRGRDAVPMFFGSDDCDNSDPYPYRDGVRFVFAVTTCATVLKGGYNLIVADRATRTVRNLDELVPDANSHLEELGPAWSGTAPFPKGA